MFVFNFWSLLKTQVPQQAKKRSGVYQKACFKGKRRKREIYIYIYTDQRAFKVFVGDPFAQSWCIDLGLLCIFTLVCKFSFKHICREGGPPEPLAGPQSLRL